MIPLASFNEMLALTGHETRARAVHPQARGRLVGIISGVAPTPAGYHSTLAGERPTRTRSEAVSDRVGR